MASESDDSEIIEDCDDFNDDSNDDFNEDLLVQNCNLDVGPACRVSCGLPTIKNQRAADLSQLSAWLIEKLNIRVLPGGIILTYDPESGCFLPEQNPAKRIRSALPREVEENLSSKNCKEIVALIQTTALDGVQVAADCLNDNENLINCENGVIQLDDISLSSHNPEFLFSYCVHARYLTDAASIQCPTFDQFCKTSLDGDPLKRQLILEIIGYCCCDSNAAKCGLFLKGAPDSGKSVNAEFLTRLFGVDLVANIPLHNLSDRFNKAELFGKKVNIAGEIKAKKLTDISIFKSVTGSDRIAAEFKNENVFSFAPRCKLVFAGNALPGTTETDATKAFANRLVVLLFNQSVPKDEQDKNLLDKLWAERDAVFTLAIDALRELKGRNFEFTLPEESKAFIQTFSERENSVQSFIRDCCEIGPEQKVHNVELLAAYRRYCTENGLASVNKSQIYDFLDNIPDVMHSKFRLGSENRWGYRGIGLKT